MSFVISPVCSVCWSFPGILLSLTGNDGNTILRKLLESREYAVKVLCLEIRHDAGLCHCRIVRGRGESRKHEKIQSVMTKITGSKAWNIVYKYIGPVGVLALTVLVICLNFSMMSDRVLWEYEAFSANTAHKSVDGILQVLYYWDNHPPLYYYWLKLFGTLFGYQRSGIPSGFIGTVCHWYRAGTDSDTETFRYASDHIFRDDIWSGTGVPGI